MDDQNASSASFVRHYSDELYRLLSETAPVEQTFGLEDPLDFLTSSSGSVSNISSSSSVVTPRSSSLSTESSLQSSPQLHPQAYLDESSTGYQSLVDEILSGFADNDSSELDRQSKKRKYSNSLPPELVQLLETDLKQPSSQQPSNQQDLSESQRQFTQQIIRYLSFYNKSTRGAISVAHRALEAGSLCPLCCKKIDKNRSRGGHITGECISPLPPPVDGNTLQALLPLPDDFESLTERVLHLYAPDDNKLNDVYKNLQGELLKRMELRLNNEQPVEAIIVVEMADLARRRSLYQEVTSVELHLTAAQRKTGEGLYVQLRLLYVQAQAYHEWGQTETALKLALQIKDLHQAAKVLPKGQPICALDMKLGNFLGDIYRTLMKYDESRASFQMALQFVGNSVNRINSSELRTKLERRRRSEISFNLGLASMHEASQARVDRDRRNRLLKLSLKQFEDARTGMMLNAESVALSIFKEHIVYSQLHLNLARASEAPFPDLRAELALVIAEKAKLFGPESLQMAFSYGWGGMMLAEAGYIDEAVRFFDNDLEILKREEFSGVPLEYYRTMLNKALVTNSPDLAAIETEACQCLNDQMRSELQSSIDYFGYYKRDIPWF